MSELEGKVAVVTGGARGIGAAVVRRFVAEGARVVINDLGGTPTGEGSDPTPAETLAKELNADAEAVVAVVNGGDVSDTRVGQELVDQAVGEFGRLDVLVNSAGIVRDRMIFNMPEEDWDAVIRVHLRGHFSTIKPASAYWRSLRQSDAHFRIINFTSLSGLDGAPGQPNYAAAKMGIIGFTYSLAQSLTKYGVTANAISPGAATRLVATVPVDRRANADSRPAEDDPRRSTENIVPLALYLASARSGWLTGRVLSAVGYEIGLYRNPELARQLISPEPWSYDELSQAIEQSFRPVADGLPPSWFVNKS